MINKVIIKNFKLLREETFELGDTIVLAGPNNSGKSAVLQAIATWNLALQRWLELKGNLKGKKHKSIPMTRQNFTALPLREFNLLWTDKSTVFSQGENGGKAGFPRLIEIELQGIDINPIDGEKNHWALRMVLRYQSKEQVYVSPVLDSDKAEQILNHARNANIVHVPCFSGIGIDETRFDPGRQNKLVGEGKPGDILRNLLLEIYDKSREKEWMQLQALISTLFNFTLLPPEYSPEMPSIICEYLPGVPKGKGINGLPRLDIASGGSGFHQALILFSFFLARPSSVLLLDEPDAHLHVILQRNVLDMLKDMARRKSCQLIIATHSEVIIDDTSANNIICFFHKPHRIFSDLEKDQAREALKRVSSLELILAEQSGLVLYLEGESDYKIMREFAKLLDHPSKEFFEIGLLHPNNGAHPKEGKAHLFALRAINPQVRGLMILDRDNRDLPERDISTEGLEILRWKRYEVENYLLIPEALKRFCASYGGIEPTGGDQWNLFSEAYRKNTEDFINRTFAKDAIDEPLKDSPFLTRIAASKDVLPDLFKNVGIHLDKMDYYQIVSYLKKDEIHEEITFKLDAIWKSYLIAHNQE